MIARIASLVRVVYRLGRAVARKLSHDCISAYAGQASFFMIISAIPFLLLLTSVLPLLLPRFTAGPELMDWIYAWIPEPFLPILEQVLGEIPLGGGISVLSFSGITLLWASARGFRSLNDGIRNVYGTRLSLSLVKRYAQSLITTLILVAVIAASLIAMLLGEWLGQEVFGGQKGLMLLMTVRDPLILFALSLLFALLFYFLSDRSIPYRRHLPGAVFSSVGWSLFSRFYALYITSPNDPYLIYGGLSALMLLMLWVYFCMTILLLGAEWNAWLWSVQKRE